MLKPKICGYLMLGSLALAGTPAGADTMTITYRSGQVQTVAMDEPSGEVSSITYQRSALPSAAGPKVQQAPAARELGSRPEPAPEIGKDQPAAKKKPGVTIKWAPPMDE